MSPRKQYIVILFIFLIASSLIHFSLLSDEYVINADFTRGSDTESLVSDYNPIWNEQGGYSNIFRLSKLFIYTPVATLNNLGLNIPLTPVYFIYFTILSTISAISVFILSRYIVMQSKEKLSKFGEGLLISSAFFYIFSTYVVEQVTHPAIRYGFYLAPLILLTLIKGVNEGKRKYLIVTAFSWSLASSDMHWIIFGSAIILGYIIYHLVYKLIRAEQRRINTIKDSLQYIFIIFGFFLLINSYWIIPGVLSGGTTLYGNILTEESNQLLFRNAHMSNIIAMKGNFNLYEIYGETPHFLGFLNDFNLNVFLIILTIMGLSSFIFVRKKSKEQIFFGLLIVIAIFISAGPHFAPGLFNWFTLDAPLNSLYGWAFRSPKFHQFLILALAPMLALTGLRISEIISRKSKIGRKSFPFIFLGAVLIFSLIPNYPLLTGDFNGNLKTVNLPRDFEDSISYLNLNQDSNQEQFKAIWGTPYVGIKSSWHDNKIGDLTNYISPIPTFSNSLFNDNLNYPVLFGTRFPHNSITYRNETKHLAEFYAPLNIKYILVHNDIPELEPKTEVLLENLMNQENLELVKTNGFISIYKINNVSPIISIKNVNTLLFGGLRNYNSLTYLEKCNFSEVGIFYYDQIKSQDIWNISNVFILDRTLDLMSIFDRGKIIEPFKENKHYNPGKLWSKTKMNSAEFRTLLFLKGLKDTYQFDYGEGLVVTWASSISEETPSSKNEDLLIMYDFEDNLAGWNISAPNIQKIFLSNISQHGDRSITVELNSSAAGWKTVSSPLIPVTCKSQYKLMFYVRGKDTHGVHAKVVEYNDTKEAIKSNHMGEIGRGDFEWREVSFDFVPTSSNTKYMQLQIWHGDETSEPLPNRIWVDDVRVYDLSNYLKSNSLDIPFNVEKDGSYELYIRYFQNQEGGQIGIHLDEDPLDIIETKDQLNKFTWRHLKTLDLKRGDHTLALENIEGFNAVNVFALIPSSEYENIEMEMYDLLKEKRVIYLFEAETDLYRENTEVLNVGSAASNGEVLPIQVDSKIWRNIEIIREGNYTIALRLSGSALIKFDNQTFTVNSTHLDFVYFDLYLEQGEHKIELSSDQYQPITWTFDESEKDFEEWNENTPESLIYDLSLDEEHGTKSLKAELNNSTWGWKLINSPLIPISFNKEYLWGFEIKGENAHEVHAKIVEYNKSKNIIQAAHLGSIGDGTFDWKNVSFSFKPTCANTSYMQLQIWHGHNTPQPLPNTIWLDNVRTLGHSPSQIDVLWIYSAKENETIYDIFSSKENPAKIITYEKINPTKYIMTINATVPFMLSFAESYDPLWAAYVNGKEYKPIPLYAVINGFWIDKTGDLEIVIRYKPQDWFEIGMLISTTTLIGCIGYTLYDWKKSDERIRMIQKKIRNILKKKK